MKNTQVGIASPNPSFPSPVKVVDGSYNLLVQNKNLADINNTEIGKAWNNSSASNRAILLILAKPNEKYTISWQDISGIDGIYVGQRTNAETVGTGVSQITSTNTQTMGADKTILLIQFNKSNITLADIQAIGLQVEKGSTATPYVSHAQQTQTIDTSPNPLYSQNDYYYKQNGNWYVHNEYAEIILNGTTNNVKYIDLSGLNTGYKVIGDILTPTDNSHTVNLKSNYFTEVSINAMVANTSIGIGVRTDTVVFLSFGNDSNFNTTEKINTWLSNHNTSIYYPLATAKNTQITNTTLINQLEALQNMLAYQDQTNISQTHNTAQADMRITADTIMSLRYMQKEIENLSSRLALLE